MLMVVGGAEATPDGREALGVPGSPSPGEMSRVAGAFQPLCRG